MTTNHYGEAANDKNISGAETSNTGADNGNREDSLFPPMSVPVIDKRGARKANLLWSKENATTCDLSIRTRGVCTSPAPSGACAAGVLDFALDQIDQALYLVDENECFIQVNNQACEMLGYTRSELLEMRVRDIDPDFTGETRHKALPEMQGRTSFRQETRHRTKNGRTFPVEVSIKLFSYEDQPYSLALVRDISERQEAAAILSRYRQDFRAMVEDSLDLVVRYDQDGARSYANPAFVATMGKPLAELLGKRPSENGNSPALLVFEARLHEVLVTGRGCEFEFEFKFESGRHTYLVRMTPDPGENGEVTGVLCVGHDIGALIESRQRLEQAEALAHIGHWEWVEGTETSRLSAEVCRIFGQAADWRPRLNELHALIIDEDRERIIKEFYSACRQGLAELSCSYRIKQGEGGIRYLHSHARIEYGELPGVPIRVIGTTQDVTELKTYEYYLNDLANNDSLTGLPNRMQFHDRASKAVAEASRKGTQVGILVMNLDRFKGINDSFGHDIGDRILFEVAERLKRAVRSYDTVARLNGDQFAFVAPGIKEGADLEQIAGKVFQCFADGFLFQDKDIYITPSIGIAMYPADASDASTLLQYADAALGHAKERGRACYQFYDSELTTRSRARLMLEAALRQAIPRQELEVYYQPKIDLGNGRLVGAEALLRWHHPELGMVPPDKFIGVAEDSGQIASIGAWVLHQACLTAERWNRGCRPVKIAVNLSSRQFRNDDLLTTVCNTLALTGCEPQWLELEITESLLLDGDAKVRKTLQAFCTLGITIAIDDFGTGYSALGYLKRFPINVLKIDRSFTSDITIDRDNTELVKAIISMARSLNLELVAEGIETKAQEEFLQAHGCHLGQGYLYSQPVPRDVFEARMLPGSNNAFHWTT